ncbi:hypothetical protein B0H12DRAFT_1027960 [Mycena haematopus]|nr:hypothetical protein B0H12DRAFT_1027960 [Mycena haematopus]
MNDPVHTFLMEAQTIMVEAQFVVDSFPNAELPAVERSAHQLGAVQQIVFALEDDARLWRDVRKDSLEVFRQIFAHLEETELLDMENPVHAACLYLVFHNRIQASLDRTREAWNHHQLRTERHKTPVALYELSREAAIQRGYWTGDPGDYPNDVNELYGYDGDAPPPPVEPGEPLHRMEQPSGATAEREAGILVTDDEELLTAKELLGDFNYDRDDSNWGIDVYCEAVVRMTTVLCSINVTL